MPLVLMANILIHQRKLYFDHRRDDCSDFPSPFYSNDIFHFVPNRPTEKSCSYNKKFTFDSYQQQPKTKIKNFQNFFHFQNCFLLIEINNSKEVERYQERVEVQFIFTANWVIVWTLLLFNSTK